VTWLTRGLAVTSEQPISHVALTGRKAHGPRFAPLAALWLVSILTSSCAATTTSNAGSGGRVDQSTSSATETNSRDCDDVNLVASLRQYTSAWNKAAEPFVADFLDPNVSGEQFLAGGATNLTAMEQAASGLRSNVVRANNRQLRDLLMAISDNYQVKLLAAKAVVTSVENTDEVAQTSATKQLSAAALDGRKLADDLQDFVKASPQFASVCPQP
jgi:hypothetical protein